MDKTHNRFLFLDYLRGIMILLVVFDHSMHIYSQPFKKFWFIQDLSDNSSLFFDIWHMHNDAIMMPMLFLLAGMFVLPSLKRRGFIGFIKEKIWRLLVPFVIGITLIVPTITYIKHLVKIDDTINFITYFTQIYFNNEFTLAGFWFLSYLLLLISICVLLKYTLPKVLNVFAVFMQFIINKPIRGLTLLICIITIIVTISDFLFGAHHWVSMQNIIAVRASRFLLKALLFFLGVGFSIVQFNQNTQLLQKLANSWYLWLTTALMFSMAYISYSLNYFYDGAYNIEILRFIVLSSSGIFDAIQKPEFWQLIIKHGPMIAIRVFLFSGFLCTAIVAYFACFKKFIDRDIPWMKSLATCSFGIYVFHEPIVLQIHYLFYMKDFPNILKFLITGTISLGFSWMLVQYLKKSPIIKKIL